MKEIGNFLIIIGLLYGFYKLIGTEPNVNSWWVQLGLGLIIYGIGELGERAERKRRQRKAEQRMQEVIDRQEQWRKERGL